MGVHYVSYLLDLTEKQVRRPSVAYGPDPEIQPTNAFEWKIVCDANGLVVVRAEANERPVTIASARWSGSLDERTQGDPETPNEHQWALVEDTLRGELARIAQMGSAIVSPRPVPVDNATEPEPKRLHHRPGPIDRKRLREVEKRLAKRRREGKPQAATTAARRGPMSPWRVRLFMVLVWTVLMGGVVGLGMCIGGVFHRDEPEPTTQRGRKIPGRVTPTDAAPTLAAQIASAASFADALALATPTMRAADDLAGSHVEPLVQYAAARLRWTDVDGPPETTIGHVEKDFERERGKRMCAAGTLVKIEAREVVARKIYGGALRTAEGDLVGFIAVGSTGELVKRSTGTLCGVVVTRLLGVPTLLGMFDLPENRSPVVEQP